VEGTVITIRSLDHLVLTVADIDASIEFYTRVLGMEEVVFAGGRRALAFGDQKINLHQRHAEFEPKAQRPTPGSADFCLLTDTPREDILRHLSACGVPVVEGPVERSGATGPLISIYVRDPDGNLVEIARPSGNTSPALAFSGGTGVVVFGGGSKPRPSRITDR
jgi:catechol 2,3-dioxygenase-like lactoylglutathione lyase family enzyme